MNRNFKEYNISILADFYEYTMAQGYFNENLENKITYFDFFIEIILIVQVMQFFLD